MHCVYHSCILLTESHAEQSSVIVTGPPVVKPNFGTDKDGPPWQRKLESAQANLFCKELFTQVGSVQD